MEGNWGTKIQKEQAPPKHKLKRKKIWDMPRLICLAPSKMKPNKMK